MMEEEIKCLEQYQSYCKNLLSIFSEHNKDNPKTLEGIEAAIIFLIERFSSVVHSLPPLIDVYYKNKGVNGHSIYSVIRSFSLDAMQACEYTEVINRNNGKDETTVTQELDEIASRHFCDKIWDLVKGLERDSRTFKTILNRYPYCFVEINGRWQNAYKNREQPNQNCITMKGIDKFHANMLNLYQTSSKIEHVSIVGFDIIRAPKIFKETIPPIIKIDMKMYLMMLTFLHEGAFEKYDISKPIIEELNKE